MIASVESEITFPICPLRVEDYQMTITTPRTFVSYSDSNVVREKGSPEWQDPMHPSFLNSVAA
jgi:hypothetical protein